MIENKPIISAVGKYLPEKILTNNDLEKLVDTSNEWIKSRTGIERRHIVSEGQASVDMSVKAINNLKRNFNLDCNEIDLIIVATTTPDRIIPSTASQIQKTISATNAAALDISVACSGFVYGMSISSAFIESNKYKKILLVGVDTMSSILNFNDRNTCVLFGDGAGVVLIEPGSENGIIDNILKSDGNGGENLYMDGGGSLNPATHNTINDGLHFVRQDGKSVFKKAVNCMVDICSEIMSRNDLNISDIDMLIPHQANKRIIDLVGKQLNIDKEKVFINIDKYANTTAATIPICIDEIYSQNLLRKGDDVIITAFGAGYSWGSTYLKWSL